MDLTHIIHDLSRPEAYPYSVNWVEVAQTHISVVFLAGPFVYKIKKPVQLGFLDFSSLDKRHFFCEQEVLLNRRLAPNVYLGVVPVALDSDGQLHPEGDGEVIEWAVKMRHMPEAVTLENRLARGEANETDLRRLAGRLAAFHKTAATNAHIQSFGQFDMVAGNARENFTQSEALVGVTVSQSVFERIRQLTEQHLSLLATLIESRAVRGQTRDTHGDLRLEHVYLFPDQPTPDDVVILDCIEFNERFRFADLISDAAFLVMDLLFQGYRDLARSFAAAYLQAANDADGGRLIPFYTAYRSVVRGKVEGFKLKESEVSAGEKEVALGQAHAHWLLALGELEEPARRPCLVLAGGLPGTGKSTLARGLAECAGFNVLRSDVIRKELAGISPESTPSPELTPGLYSAESTEKTYRECLRRAEDLFFEGRRVLVDANFRQEHYRRLFLQTAQHWGVPGLFLHCWASPEMIRGRLQGRTQDASDADWNIFTQLAGTWEPASAWTAARSRALNADGSQEDVLQQALYTLRREELAE